MTEFYINQKVKSKFLTYHKEMFIGRFTKGCTDVEVGGIPFTEFYMNESIDNYITLVQTCFFQTQFFGDNYLNMQ
jgi:hypothetical protein